MTRTPRPFAVRTPFVNANVEGTEFSVRVDDNGTVIAVMEGRVSASNEQGTLELTDGGAALTVAKSAPKAIVLRPADAVQWALYYPPIVEPGGGSAAPAALREAQSLYRDNRFADAIARLEGRDADVSSAGFLTFRASLLLRVGRIDDAIPDLERALALEPASGDAQALLAITALAVNDKERARRLAVHALELDPRSTSARIALSYVQQSEFKIDDALATTRAAVDQAPDNALAQARLAELLLSVGDESAALAAADRARQLQPGLSRTHTIAGFAALAGTHIAEALSAFTRAVALDPSDPVARLGLGLARIRGGDLQGGREDLEVAAVLDPVNSLLRSYLGKVYYDEGRPRLSRSQLDLAKSFDSRDPTPWLYQALAAQQDNDAIEAFSALQQALERNDARAVTRSRLLLDQDKATMSASLAQIYSDLGFQQLALSTAYRDLAFDPANPALHKFLAETYLASSGLDSARPSEALQAQLYQPLGVFMTDPLIGENRLFLLKASGIKPFFRGDPARLLDRSGVTLNVEGFGGTRDTAGYRILGEGTGDVVAGSIGAVGFRSDGFRPEEPLKEHSASAFVQAALDSRTSVQAQWVRSFIDRGELLGAFDPDSVLPVSDQEQIERLRFGLRHSPTPNVDTVVSAVTEKATFKQSGLGFGFEDTDTHSRSVEAQATIATPAARYVVGVGGLWADTTSNPTDLSPDPFKVSRSQSNAYAYAYPRLTEGLIATLGLSLDRSKLGDREVHSVNPKLGAFWQPADWATFHAAALKSLQRDVVSSLTIEPTQFAAVNQMLFGVEQTRWRHYGAGADFRLAGNAYVGFDVVERRGKFPLGDDWRNFSTTTGRAYFNKILTPHLAFAAEYYYDRYHEPNEDGDALLGRTSLRTHRVPLTLTWQALPSANVQLRGTYVQQSGLLQSIGGPAFHPDHGFWVADLDFTYRLPNQAGSIQLVVRNLFNKRFAFEEPDIRNPVLAASNLILLSVRLQFPNVLHQPWKEGNK
jgi:tetratricopeptide (TPR) repeat protein